MIRLVTPQQSSQLERWSLAGVLLAFLCLFSQTIVAQQSPVPLPPENLNREIGEQYALLRIPRWKPVRFQEDKVPAYMKDAFVYEPVGVPDGKNLGTLKYEVERGGMLVLEISYKPHEELERLQLFSRDRMELAESRGWLELWECPWNERAYLYAKRVKTGDKFPVWGSEFIAHRIFLIPPIDFEDPQHLHFLTVKYQEKVLKQKILTLFKEKKYSDLEALGDVLRERRAKFPTGKSQLLFFYETLGQPHYPYPSGVILEKEWSDQISLLENWAILKPKSVASRIALGYCYKRAAWSARGTGTASRLTPSQSRLFRERSSKAREILMDVKNNLTADDPALYSILVSTSLGHGDDHETVNGWIDESFKLDPLFIETYREAGIYFQPRWFGNEGDLETMVDRLYERTKDDYGKLIYAALGRELMFYYSSTSFYEKSPFSWSNVKAGFEDLARHYQNPKANRNSYCWMACVARDRTTARTLFAELKHDYEKPVWKNEKWFRYCREIFKPGVDEGNHTRLLHGHLSGVADVACSDDGSVFATAGRSGDMCFWDPNTATEQHRFDIPNGEAMTTPVFAPKTLLLASGGVQGRIWIWNLAEKKADVFVELRTAISSLAWSQDGKYLAAGGRDGTLAVWEVETKKMLRGTPKYHKATIVGLGFLADGRLLSVSTGDLTAKVLDLEKDPEEKPAEFRLERNRQPTAMAMSPDRRHFCIGVAHERIVVWDALTQKQVATTKLLEKGLITALEYTPDGKQIVIGVGNDEYFFMGGAYLWSGKDQEPVKKVTKIPFAIPAIAVSPDGSMLYTGGMDWTLRYWNIGETQ